LVAKMTFTPVLMVRSPAALCYEFNSSDIPGTESSYVGILIPDAPICEAHYAFPKFRNSVEAKEVSSK
jgi:hypothetical protein